MKIKNWEKFQHFKDRRPPWIKLYRDLLDDAEWAELSPPNAKFLIMLWLLASEEKGELPDTKTIAFRLRMSEKSVKSIVSELSHWLIQDDINTISHCHQLGPSETEAYTKERETYNTETELCVVNEFESFWNAYPKKIGKKAAELEWKKAVGKPNLVDLLQTIEASKQSEQWTKDNGQFIPHPSTWLHQGRWADEPIKKPVSTLEAFLNRKDHDEPLRIR